MAKSLKRLAWRYHGGKIVFDLVQKDKYMMYRIDGTKKGYFFSYNEELLRIFKEINLTPYKRPDKRLSFTYRDETGKHCHLMAHNLAHGVYKGYIHYESFYEDVRAYIKAKGELTVDHADGNVFNNTKHNLSLMTLAMNRKKGNITKKFNAPEGVVIGVDGDFYRVCFLMRANRLKKFIDLGVLLNGTIPEGIMATVHFICNSADTLVDCLNSFTNAHFSWRTPFRKNGRWIDTSGKSRVENTLQSIKEQEILMNIPIDGTVFTSWKWGD